MIDEDENLVFEATRALIETGQYLDCIPGLPGVAIDGSRPLDRTPDGRLQRLYWRGTPEYDAARHAGHLERLPPLTPAPLGAVEECEQLLGHSLPPLLRRCYLELGNGGFGPGYGILGLRDGHATYCETALDGYRHLRPHRVAASLDRRHTAPAGRLLRRAEQRAITQRAGQRDGQPVSQQATSMGC